MTSSQWIITSDYNYFVRRINDFLHHNLGIGFQWARNNDKPNKFEFFFKIFASTSANLKYLIEKKISKISELNGSKI